MRALGASSRITPFLWFDSNAEEAVAFYLSIFPNSRRLGELRNTGDAPGPKGGVLTVSFELDGLTEGGAEVACGWLRDKFGLSWQITPARIGELLKTSKAMQAMMKMKKFDIAELERAGLD